MRKDWGTVCHAFLTVVMVKPFLKKPDTNCTNLHGKIRGIRVESSCFFTLGKVWTDCVLCAVFFFEPQVLSQTAFSMYNSFTPIDAGVRAIFLVVSVIHQYLDKGAKHVQPHPANRNLSSLPA